MPNRFSQPPEAIVYRGMSVVKEYFEDLLREEGKYIAERRDVKAVIIGEAGAGKTRYGCLVESIIHVPRNLPAARPRLA